MSNTTSENFISSQITDDADKEIDLGKIFRFLLMQSKLIMSIVVIVFAISIINYVTATKQYKIMSLIQYEKIDQNIFNPSQTFNLGGSGAKPAENMIQLYESRTNYLKVIKDLNLNIKVKGLENEENIDLKIISSESDLAKSHKLKFSFSRNDYSLLDKDLNVIERTEYGNLILHDGLRITVQSSNLRDDRPIDVHFRNPESMYSSFKSRMGVEFSGATNSFFIDEGIINVAYVTDDIDLGKKIINYANNIFLNQRIYDENEKSRKAISFINENISTIEKNLEDNKNKLKQFREKNKTLNVNLEIEAIINKIESLDEALSSIDIEIAKAEEIYTKNNPSYLNLLNKKSLIQVQKENVLLEIEMMPKEEQEYIDLFKDLEVSQALFEELESRRLGFSIQEASTIGDIRVIDKAYVSSMVSPRLLTVVLSTILAFIAACIVAIFRGLYFLPISNPAEIFDNGVYEPIIGVVPFIKDFREDEAKLNTSIETLIVNINSLQNNEPNKNLLTITSPSAGNGKSTISMRLADGFAKIGKKVLLLDNDLKRGNLSGHYDIRSISETTFNSINETTISKYIIHDNLFLIPRVKGLKNSFQFLYSAAYMEKIKFFKDYFDIVIFDTGPILAVADTSMLIQKSDINIVVCRHGINKINEIRQCRDNFKQINKTIDGLIYNAYAKPHGYYGYYGLYGNYSYQYYADRYLDDTYEYEKKD